MQSTHAAVVLSFLVLVHAGVAAALTVVPGKANPNLAGRADGYTCCSGDSAPSHSPALAVDVELEDCASLHISSEGRVSFTSNVADGDNPDGDGAFSMTNFGDGISAPLNVRVNAMLGVFLDDDSPTGNVTPSRLDFGGGLDFMKLEPGLGQIFFIGDGLTSDTQAGLYDGGVQSFVVPPRATRLFLGTVDGSGWFNNAGSFQVEFSSSPYEPLFACGDPADPAGITTSDALRALRAAVGTALCAECVCDVDLSGLTAASDALAILRRAVGQEVELRCSCCPDLV